MSRVRALSFHDVDPEQTSGILSDVFKESNVYLGGSSMGKGLKKAARFYLEQRINDYENPDHFKAMGAQDLKPDCDMMPVEEPFYIVDLGIVVSQVYQCK